MILQVRCGHIRGRAREQTQLARCHGEWTAAKKSILQSHHRLAPQTVGLAIECFDAPNLEDTAQLQMILQILPHAGRIKYNGNAQRLQVSCRPDSRTLQDRRGSQTARCQNRLDAAAGDHLLSLDRELDTLDPAAIQYQPIAESVRHYCEVGTVEHWTQERLGAVPAHTALLVHLELADTMIVPAVEVIGHGNTRLLSGFGETVENIPAQALTFHAPLIAGTMDLAATAPVVLHALEERQNAFPAPAGVT